MLFENISADLTTVIAVIEKYIVTQRCVGINTRNLNISQSQNKREQIIVLGSWLIEYTKFITDKGLSMLDSMKSKHSLTL